ncbi:hypothetical protein [Mycobacteroides abscessus]|nr:hypothetical protein [Mycobacteroides abscessus]MDO2978301.1 hypothetical protein [Mycobacteroides abscessus subsp. abscessus]
MSEPTQPPEAELIERLRTQFRPKLSVRSAARAADMSDSRWRQIIKGYRQETADLRVPVRAPAVTLARMALVVGATADELRDVGREDAVEELQDLIQQKESARRTAARLRQAAGLPAQEGDPPLPRREIRRRPDPNLGVGPDGEFLSAEAMFAEWQQARNRMLNAVLGYARARAIPFATAQSELDAVQQMTNDVTYGRPWTPPWDPGAEFDEDDEPWRAHWWWEPDGVAAAERLGLEPSKWMLGPTVGRDVTSIEDLRRPSSSQANEDQDADPAIGSGGLFRGTQRAAESNLGHARDPVETENRDSSTEIGQSSPAKGREGDEVSEGASGDPISRLAQSGPDIHQRKTAKRGERQHR